MRILVTGATGFLGSAFCRRLVQDGLGTDAPEVIATGRRRTAGEALERDGIRFVPAELADRTAVVDLCTGVDTVVHAGAKSAPWGPYRDFYAANVRGTENVIAGCRTHGVKRLVHVSTPSVYFDGKDRFDVAEDTPLPRPVNAYTRTKLLAEAAVDRAYADGLPVLTLRPRALFGPGDRTLLPRLIEALEARRLPVIGRGDNVVDLTYIDNAVAALVCCLQAPESCLGRKYNITNGEPVPLWPLITSLAQRLDLPPPSRRLPYPAAYLLAAVLEVAYRTLPLRPEPPMTRYSVGVLARSMTLDIRAARRDLGYRPEVGIDDGLRRFAAWWRRQR